MSADCRHVPLSSIDNTLVEIHIAVLWAYADAKYTAPQAFDELAARLSAALTATVDRHFPLLNHAVSHSDQLGYFFDTATRRPPVFQTAEAPDDHPAPHPPDHTGNGAWQPPMCAYQPGALAPDPLDSHQQCLAVRLTRLNGGVAVLALLHHIVGDAASLVALMRAVSDVAELGADAAPAPPVVEDRALLRGRVATRALLRGRVATRPLPAPLTCSNEVAQRDVVPALLAMGSGERALLQPWRRRYQRSELEALKARYADGGDFAPSSNDVLVAIAVQQAAAALPREQPFGALFPANMRQRCPHLPDGYFGNAVVLCVTPQSTAGAIAAAPLAELVRSVHDAKVHWATADRLTELLDWEASRPSKPRAAYSVPWQQLGITNWTTFPFFDVTLGIGVPVLVTPAYPGWIDRLGFIMPTEPSAAGAVDLIFTMPSS